MACLVAESVMSTRNLIIATIGGFVAMSRDMAARISGMIRGIRNQ
jgi:hypothetical protein